MFRKQYAFYQDPGLPYPGKEDDLPFSEYIIACRNLIKETRQNPSDIALEANTPFELRPLTSSKITAGALLIHGLLDSPFWMKEIGTSLQSQGLLVRSILLPGHGTVPGHLLHVDFEEWLQTVRYGITTLAKEVDRIYLVGFSTGASLALFHALTDKHIAGIVMISPAFKIRSSIDFTANWHRIISWAKERAKWVYLSEEIDYAKYQSIPFNAVYQVYRLTKAIKKINDQAPHCPLFMAFSLDDRTVCSRTSLQYFTAQENPKNRAIVYANGDFNSHDSRITTRNSFYPNLHIKNFSHVSIPIAPDNPHYGKKGNFIYASRVDNDEFIYSSVNKVDDWRYKMLYQLNLIPARHQRLSFNPDFSFLLEEIKKFCSDA